MLNYTIDSDVFGWIILFAGPLLALYLARGNRPLSVILLAGWLARAVLALTHNYFFQLPDTQFDALNFQHWAYVGAQNGLSGAISHFTTGAYIYPSIISFLYLLTGPSQLVMQAVNVLLGMGIIYLTYRLTLDLWDSRSAMVAAILAAFWPTLLLYSAITMREAFVVFFLMLSLLFIQKWMSQTRIFYGILSVFFMFISLIFHTGMAAGLLAIGALGLAVFIRSYIRIPQSSYFFRLLPLLIIAAGIATVVLTTGIGLEKFKGGVMKLGVEMLAEQQEYVSKSRAKYLDNYIVDSWDDLITNAPIRIFYFLFSPFPWSISSFQDLMGAVDGILYFISACSITYLLITRRINKTRFSILFVFTCLIYLFSFVTSNSGTALRHRAKMAPMMISLMAPIFKRNKYISKDNQKYSPKVSNYNLKL